MPIAWQTKQLYNNELQNFEFEDTIQSFFVGISGFRVEFPYDDDHQIQHFGARLSVNKSADNLLQVSAELIWEDWHGSKFDHERSWIFATAVVWLGSSSLAATLLRAEELCAGQQQLPIPGPLEAVSPALASFRTDFADSDYHLSAVGAEVTATPYNPETVEVRGETTMYDNSGNSAECTHLAGGVLAQTDPSPGFEMRLVEFVAGETNRGSANFRTEPVTFSQQVTRATAILTSFRADFGAKDFWAKGVVAGALEHAGSVYIGPPETVHINVTDVSVTTNVTMYNDVEHGDETTSNSATLLVIAAFD